MRLLFSLTLCLTSFLTSFSLSASALDLMTNLPAASSTFRTAMSLNPDLLNLTWSGNGLINPTQKGPLEAVKIDPSLIPTSTTSTFQAAARLNMDTNGYAVIAAHSPLPEERTTYETAVEVVDYAFRNSWKPEIFGLLFGISWPKALMGYVRASAKKSKNPSFMFNTRGAVAGVALCGLHKFGADGFKYSIVGATKVGLNHPLLGLTPSQQGLVYVFGFVPTIAAFHAPLNHAAQRAAYIQIPAEEGMSLARRVVLQLKDGVDFMLARKLVDMKPLEFYGHMVKNNVALQVGFFGWNTVFGLLGQNFIEHCLPEDISDATRYGVSFGFQFTGFYAGGQATVPTTQNILTVGSGLKEGLNPISKALRSTVTIPFTLITEPIKYLYQMATYQVGLRSLRPTLNSSSILPYEKLMGRCGSSNMVMATLCFFLFTQHTIKTKADKPAKVDDEWEYEEVTPADAEAEPTDISVASMNEETMTDTLLDFNWWWELVKILGEDQVYFPLGNPDRCALQAAQNMIHTSNRTQI